MKAIILFIAIIFTQVNLFPIGSKCLYNEYMVSQAYCGTKDVEKLVCAGAYCLGTKNNNMCGTDSDLCDYGLWCHNTLKVCTDCVANCAICTDGTTCGTCYLGFFVDSTTKLCVEGPANCALPTDKTTCGTCKSGYFWNTAGSTSFCDTGPASCNVTVSKTECKVCNEGLYWDSASMTCKGAISNCAWGASSTSCYECKPYYYEDAWTTTDTICQGPVPNCDVIQTPGYCTVCADGYFLKVMSAWSNSCIKISTYYGCQVAASETLCATCLPGYIRWPKCYSPINNCLTAASITACSVCQDEYVADSDGVCQWCGFGVKKCSVTGTTAGDAIECQEGYVLSAVTKKCVYCGYSGVKACTIGEPAASTSADLVAIICKEGWTLDGAGGCITCESDTVSCTYSETYKITNVVCQDNFVFISGSGCTSCGDAGIKSCKVVAGSVGDPTECMTGYKLVSATCVACASGPANYGDGASDCTVNSNEDVTSVTSCYTNRDAVYYADSQNYVLIDNAGCYPCIDGAATCTASKVALSGDSDDCEEGTAYCDGKCIKCTAFSTTCAVDADCKAGDADDCIEGYIMTSTKTCKSCGTNADSCTIDGSDKVTTDGCIDGYYLTSKAACAACSVKGSTCADTTGAFVDCLPKWYKSGSTCVACATGATTCAAGTASVCADGYFLADGPVCALCSAGMTYAATCHCVSNAAGYVAAEVSAGKPACASGKHIEAYTCASGHGIDITDRTTCATLCPSNGIYCSADGILDSDQNYPCADGYMANELYTACVQCDTYQIHCEYDDGLPVTCSLGYVLSVDGATCEACGSNGEKSCTMASDSTITVTSCFPGFGVSTDKTACVNCGDNSYSCSIGTGDTPTIDACAEGYILQTTGTEPVCINDGSDGIAAYAWITVTSCSDGYYASSTGCIACVDGVKTCDAAGTVSACSYGYGLSSGSPKTCISCNGASGYNYIAACNFETAAPNTPIATACYDGYFVNTVTTTAGVKQITCTPCTIYGNADNWKTCTANALNGATPAFGSCWDGSYGSYTCVDGPSQCKTITTPTSCSACNDGYYVIPNAMTNGNKCNSCGTGAISCTVSATGTVTITNCDAAYYKVLTNNVASCSLCTAHCSSCAAGVCSACATGYYLTSDKPATCTACGAGIKTCTAPAAAGGNPSVTACLDSFYLDTTGACSPCTETNCKTCSSDICTACKDGYFVLSNKCFQSTSNCKTCHQIPKCGGCGLNYYWDEASIACKTCGIANCNDCSTLTNCLACATGYYNNGGNCTKCANLTNCDSCSGPTTCDQCSTSYFWDGSAKSCKNCSTGCEICAEASTCFKCKVGYYKDPSTGLCKACSTGCAYCTDASNCTTCLGKYLLQLSNGTLGNITLPKNGTCASCYAACATCTSTLESGCATCPDNSTLKTKTVGSVSGSYCECSSNYTWSTELLKCIQGTSGASYLFAGLLSLLVILFALLQKQEVK